jgi:hypothetical protein
VLLVRTELAVDGAAYVDAVTSLVTGNRRAADAHHALVAALSGSGAMAGDDSTSASFASAYDSAAASLVEALSDAVTAFASLGFLTSSALANHEEAESASVGGGNFLPPPEPNLGLVTVLSWTPPSALGGDGGDRPPLWDQLEAHLEGLAWPNADTARLRAAARSWRAAAADVAALPSYCHAAGDHLTHQRSPEIPIALAALDELTECLWELRDGCRALAESCDDYADSVEEHRAIVRGILTDLAVEAGLSIAAGVVLGLVTAGGGTAAGSALAGWRISAAARRVVAALRALASVAHAGAIARMGVVAGRVGRVRGRLEKYARVQRIRAASRLRRVDLRPAPVSRGPRAPGTALPHWLRPEAAGKGWRGRVADTGKGDVWRSPEARTPNGDQIRIMDPTKKYPDGYVRFHNEHGQPIGLDGRPNVPGGTKAQNGEHTHIPIDPDGTFPTPKGWLR